MGLEILVGLEIPAEPGLGEAGVAGIAAASPAITTVTFSARRLAVDPPASPSRAALSLTSIFSPVVGLGGSKLRPVCIRNGFRPGWGSSGAVVGVVLAREVALGCVGSGLGEVLRDSPALGGEDEAW